MIFVRRIKDKVNQLFARDRGLALMVAMEAALEGERWEVKKSLGLGFAMCWK